MANFKSSLIKYLNSRDEWLYFTLAFSISLYYLESNSWREYIAHIFNNSAYLAPLILFKVFQEKIKKQLSFNLYQFCWLLSFCIYPIVIFFWKNSFQIPENISLMMPAVVVLLGALLGILLSVSIEFVLLFNRYFSQKRLMTLTLNKIGLDELLLFFLAFISIYAALLISSDLPLWYESNSVQLTISFSGVAKQPMMVISLAFQLFCLFFCGYIFYWINNHILVKAVLETRGPLIYLCAVIATVVLLYPILIELYLLLPINSMAEPIIPAVNADAFDWQNGRVFLAVMLLSLPVILVIHWHKKSNQFALLEKENIQTELQLLKQQIDPHFFFNTLNNLYALCRKKSKQAPEVVLQLAELMQYVVYRGQEPSVSINEEISYLNDYINLQSIRLSNKISLDINVNVDDQQTVITPLLLIILVENAFKHGIEPATKNCSLSIQITVENKQLIFICENSLEEDTSSEDIKESVGLSNLKRRLTLIYPSNYQLTLNKYPNRFVAQLNINLSAAIFLNKVENKNE